VPCFLFWLSGSVSASFQSTNVFFSFSPPGFCLTS
jgi:hypothetical protein